MTKKDLLTLIIVIITSFMIAFLIFSDWEHFKNGLFG